MKMAIVEKIIVQKDDCRRKFRILMVRCPFCSQIHHHGGGFVREDINTYLTPRIPHCGKGKGECYCLGVNENTQQLKAFKGGD